MKIFYIATVIIVMLAKPAFADFSEELRIMTEQTGELAPYADDALGGTLSFNNLWEYIKNIFFKEFKSISNNLPPLFALSVLFSLKSCIKLDEGISKLADFSISGSIVLLASGMVGDVISSAKAVCEGLGAFIFTAIPCLCGAKAASGMPVSASKGAFLTLGSESLLSFLISAVFFPVLYIVYILSVSSALVENDIFESAKKTVLSALKMILPLLVGAFTAVLSIFMKVASKTDEFILKSAKLTIGNAVPFLGNVLSESADVVVSSVGQIKSQMGLLGIFGILSVLLFPLIKMLCVIIAFKVLSAFSCFITDKKSQKYYEEMSDITGVAAGMTGTLAIMTLIGILILTE